MLLKISDKQIIDTSEYRGIYIDRYPTTQLPFALATHALYLQIGDKQDNTVDLCIQKYKLENEGKIVLEAISDALEKGIEYLDITQYSSVPLRG